MTSKVTIFPAVFGVDAKTKCYQNHLSTMSNSCQKCGRMQLTFRKFDEA